MTNTNKIEVLNHFNISYRDLTTAHPERYLYNFTAKTDTAEKAIALFRTQYPNEQTHIIHGLVGSELKYINR